VAGATLGLQQLMRDLLALHPDFAQWTPEELADPVKYDPIWNAFLDEAEWLGATAQGAWLGFKLLFERIRAGGQRATWAAGVIEDGPYCSSYYSSCIHGSRSSLSRAPS
jgi:hypothetical protein